MIPTIIAARLLRLSRSMFLRTTKHFGLKPISRRMTWGKAEGLWGKTQILGMMVAPVLIRASASEEWADVFPGLLAGAYNDEQLEAHLESGRRYLLIAGATVLPELLTESEVEERLKDNKVTIEALRIGTVRIDISELFADLMSAVRDARQAEAEELA